MKLRRKKDISKLQDTIQRELGINISKYRDEEVADNLVDLMVFPKYIVKWISRPIIIAILLYLIGFFVIDLVHIQYLLYGILGLILFLIVGALAGVLNLARKINNDLGSISDYSLGVMKNSILDIDNVGGRITKENRKDVMNMLFQGIIHVVTIPMVGKAIDNKVPVASGLVKGLVKNSLMAVSGRLDFDDDKIDENIVIVDGEEKEVSRYVQVIDRTNQTLDGTLDIVTKIVRTPFKLALYIVLGILILFLYLIW